MIKSTCLGLAALFLGGIASAQNDSLPFSETIFLQTDISNRAAKQERPNPVYRLKPKVDIPLTIGAAAWDVFAFSKIYSKDDIPDEVVRNLKYEDVNGFDRWAADVYDSTAAKSSDFFFYGAMPLPLVLMLDKDIRKDAGKVAFLYLQSMAITGVLYTGSCFIFDRYRPLTYNPAVPFNERREGGSKNSFFAGHVALVATSGFFTAKVFQDYHPDSKLRFLFWGLAGVTTVGTAYLRHKGGKHFPSDILVGTAVGTLSGILIPSWHKNKDPRANAVSFQPFTDGYNHGVKLAYKF